MTPWTCVPLRGGRAPLLSNYPTLPSYFFYFSIALSLSLSDNLTSLFAHHPAITRRKRIWNPLLLLTSLLHTHFRLIFFNMMTRKLGYEEINWNWIFLIKWADGWNGPPMVRRSMQRVYNVTGKRRHLWPSNGFFHVSVLQERRGSYVMCSPTQYL